MKNNKSKVIDYIVNNISRGKKVELSFLNEGVEYICISMDIFGSGKPEYIVLGNDTYHDGITITNEQYKTKNSIINLFRVFPENLEMTIVPNECLRGKEAD